jgi:dihydroxyacetone kinase-like predicted kinase
VRDTHTDAGDVKTGDWIGLGAGGVLAIADSIEEVNAKLLVALVKDEHELFTIIEGDGSTKEATSALSKFATTRFPQLCVEVHHGGQPLYPYYFGVE